LKILCDALARRREAFFSEETRQQIDCGLAVAIGDACDLRYAWR
jgi:hypothetical protein